MIRCKIKNVFKKLKKLYVFLKNWAVMAETAMILLKIQKGKASENLPLAHFLKETIILYYLAAAAQEVKPVRPVPSYSPQDIDTNEKGAAFATKATPSSLFLCTGRGTFLFLSQEKKKCGAQPFPPLSRGEKPLPRCGAQSFPLLPRRTKPTPLWDAAVIS